MQNEERVAQKGEQQTATANARLETSNGNGDALPCQHPDFWRSKTVDELAREQGVKPASSLRDLEGDWPPEDPIDEFLAFIREARR